MSDLVTKSSRVSGLELGPVPPLGCSSCWRFWKRRHRTVTGASMLMRMKNGRRMKTSRTSSLWMSVVTHRSRHRLVTNSRRSPAVGKVCSEDWWDGLNARRPLFERPVPAPVPPIAFPRAFMRGLSPLLYSPSTPELSESVSPWPLGLVGCCRYRCLKPW